MLAIPRPVRHLFPIRALTGASLVTHGRDLPYRHVPYTTICIASPVEILHESVTESVYIRPYRPRYGLIRNRVVRNA